jgi:glutamate synthase (NADPH/NADH) small chain
VFTEALGLQRSRQGTAVARSETGRTTLERVWAGGDIVTGAATVISAMGAGRVAANDIDAYFHGGSSGHWVQESESEPA